MKTFNAIIVVGVLLVAGVIGFNFYNQPIGSVSSTNEYSWYATSTASGVGQITSNRQTTLGSIVIATDSAGTFTVKNATSTTDALAETVATFEATTAENTYTFDILLTRGLQVTTGASFDGSYIITYR